MPFTAASPKASAVQVEINFENPVIFAGQSLNAVITFKNPLEPPMGPIGSRQNEQTAKGEKHSNDTSIPDPNLLTKTRPGRAMSERRTSPYLAASVNPGESRTLDKPTAPFINEKVPELVEPASDTNLIEPADLTTSQSTSPGSPKESGGLWDIPGRRISSQLANSFRDMYWSNASTPEVANGKSNDQRPSASNSSLAVDGNPDEALYGPQSTFGRWGSQGSRLPQHQLTRSGSTFASPRRSQATHGLLMGYTQLQGYFVLDEDLIDVEEYAHVRTQGVVVGPTGEIGYSSQNGSGLLQGLASGLGSLLQIRDSEVNSSSEGLASFGFGRSNSQSGLRRSNSRSVKPAQQQVKKDAIPIFSTPQSLLFVDLKLTPGESRSFSYKIELPKSLPPSCRAKSIRIHYNLVIGIQKLDTRGRPQPKTTLIPFRVFPHVDKYGQQYTHDLKMPIVLQRDQATVVQLPSDRHMSAEQVTKYVALKTSKGPVGSAGPLDGQANFASYVKELLSSDDTMKRTVLARHLSNDDTAIRSPITSQENIEYFSRYQHMTNPKQAVKSRFDIGRSGKRIATVLLSKPVYRIGENVVILVDYKNADLKCYRITASLETEEAINTSVLKSFKESTGTATSGLNTPTSTRRIYSQSTISTYALSRSTFEFTIPATATPQFSTSDIALKWNLKLDFITSPTSQVASSSSNKTGFDHEASISRPTPDTTSVPAPPRPSRQPSSTQATSSTGGGPTMPPQWAQLATDSKSPVHVVHYNEQGVIAGLKETIPCEAFNCKIPLTVMPTNQDIGALLEHSVSATRVISM